jgi:hypothetical protein
MHASAPRVIAHFALVVVRKLTGRRLSQESIYVVHQRVKTRSEVEVRVIIDQSKTNLILHFFELVLTHVLHELSLLHGEVGVSKFLIAHSVVDLLLE